MNTVSVLTELAVESWRRQLSGAPPERMPWQTEYEDEVLDGAPLYLAFEGELAGRLQRGAEVLLEDPDLVALKPVGGEEGLFVSVGGSGSRMNALAVVAALITHAARRMYFLRLDETEETFARLVIENLEELKRGLRGEPVRTYEIFGLTGIRLDPASRIDMPWGVITPAPTPKRQPSARFSSGWNLPTTAVLAVPRLMKAGVTRQADPSTAFDEVAFRDLQRIVEIQPLAFALALDGERCAPLVTFSTQLSPFGSGFGFGMSRHTWTGRPEVNIDAVHIPEIERWGRLLNDSHDEALGVATTRIVSAIARRSDRIDALVDAVMVWESLVGTRGETVFRVTAALARLLEPEVAGRLELRKKLAKVYDARSRAVHGEAMEADAIEQNADAAIDFALKAMRAIYLKGGPLLAMNSQTRSDHLLLGD